MFSLVLVCLAMLAAIALLSMAGAAPALADATVVAQANQYSQKYSGPSLEQCGLTFVLAFRRGGEPNIPSGLIGAVTIALGKGGGGLSSAASFIGARRDRNGLYRLNFASFANGGDLLRAAGGPRCPADRNDSDESLCAVYGPPETARMIDAMLSNRLKVQFNDSTYALNESVPLLVVEGQPGDRDSLPVDTWRRCLIDLVGRSGLAPESK